VSSLYHRAMYEAANPVPSHWEASFTPPQDGFDPLAGDAHCDVAVIGGGYTGLSTALHLARDHGVDVRVAEAGHVGWGASGRNGGFCVIPATKMPLDVMFRRWGEEGTRHFFRAQVEAIRAVEELAQSESIDYERQGDGIYMVAHKPKKHAALAEEAAALDRLGVPTSVLSEAEFAQEGHAGSEAFGAIKMHVGFGLHPLKYVAGLARAARDRGATIHGRTKVERWERGAPHRLHTPGGTLTADRVVVACNGFLEDKLSPDFRGRFMPVISNIVTTRPLTDAEVEAAGWRTECPLLNSRKLLFYYRLLPDRRLLLGTRGDYTGNPANGARMRRWMERRRDALFPALAGVETAHFWRGFVCLTERLMPALGRLDADPSVWFAYGYHGNGVATATWAGRTVARLMTGANRDLAGVPAPIRGLPGRFPLGRWRTLLLRAAYLHYRVKDAL